MILVYFRGKQLVKVTSYIKYKANINNYQQRSKYDMRVSVLTLRIITLLTYQYVVLLQRQ